MRTYHLHIRGRVQGVGFRPYVYRVAREIGLRGRVRNDADGVHVLFNSTSKQAALKATNAILRDVPPISIVQDHTLTTGIFKPFDDFRIAPSETTDAVRLLITPDLAICPDCVSELRSPDDRRYRYPFTTCTQCGPRYSIVQGLPYDRPWTTMSGYRMCAPCRAEYHDFLERRHFSQTNSCPDCPVQLFLFDNSQQIVSNDNEEILRMTRALLAEGKTIAVKGIGGYLLLVDATNESAVAVLRHRKRRPAKPFAVMYPSLEILKKDVEVPAASAQQLSGPESPIVLLPLRSSPQSGIALQQVAPGLDSLGVMLPYTGLYQLILEGLHHPLVATSGNISDAPIIFTDEAAMEGFAGLADYIMTNDREIVVPQDDSVVRPANTGSGQIILRRSRGLAPAVVEHPFGGWSKSVLATGAQLKSSFGFFHNGEVYLSQYLGDLAYLGSQQSYRHTVDHLQNVIGCRPDLVVADLHPAYFSRQFAEEVALSSGVPILEVQHHEAHFAALLGERDLLNQQDPVLGVVWDGTGYGSDGQVWGGEFFIYDQRRISRTGHLAYYRHLAGDKMPREPRLAALSVFDRITEAEAILEQRFSTTEWHIYQRLLESERTLTTSSMGRLFDAVAAILGLCDVMTYEGEAAMYLEMQGRKFWRVHHGYRRTYPFHIDEANRVQPADMLQRVVHELEECSVGEIALKFHMTLAEIVAQMADRLGVRHIAFSGGVFQNALLVDCCVERLGKEYRLYFHNQLSPNDENIAFGQLVTAFLQYEHKEIQQVQNLKYVSGNTW